MKSNNSKNLTKELIGKHVNIELKHDTILHNVKVLDVDALLIKVKYFLRDTYEILYIPLSAVKYIKVLNEEDDYESYGSGFL